MTKLKDKELKKVVTHVLLTIIILLIVVFGAIGIYGIYTLNNTTERTIIEESLLIDKLDFDLIVLHDSETHEHGIIEKNYDGKGTFNLAIISMSTSNFSVCVVGHSFATVELNTETRAENNNPPLEEIYATSFTINYYHQEFEVQEDVTFYFYIFDLTITFDFAEDYGFTEAFRIHYNFDD